MKIIKNPVLLTVIVLINLFFSCSSPDDPNTLFRYLPRQLEVSDSVVTLYTTFEYDDKNKIEKITNDAFSLKSSITHYIQTAMVYDGDILREMNSDVSIISSGDTSLIYTTKRLFTYEGTNVNVSVTNSNGIEFPSYVIELDERQRATRRAENNSEKFIVYEYDNKGNIAKTRNEADSVYIYSYDVHRGIYREVNMHPWFINSVLDIPMDTIWANFGDNLNLNNNCISIQREKSDDESASFFNLYEFTYGGFWYPTLVEDNNGFTLRVIYTSIN